jgi:CheY-like chemotaxis protein
MIKMNELSGVCVLVVDDSEDLAELTRHWFASVGAKVVTVSSGAEALVAVASQQCHLIVMDIGMPFLDGFAAAEQVRGLGYRMPIIGVTASVFDDSRWTPNFDAHFLKPVNKQLLIAAAHALTHKTLPTA